jgi:hypothetical protein
VDDPLLEHRVVVVDPQRLVDQLRARARHADARVDRAGVVVGPRVRLAPPRIHFAAAYRPSRSKCATIVSIGPVCATSSGVMISGHAPCSALVCSTKRVVAAILRVQLAVVVIDPARQPRPELLEEAAR